MAANSLETNFDFILRHPIIYCLNLSFNFFVYILLVFVPFVGCGKLARPHSSISISIPLRTIICYLPTPMFTFASPIMYNTASVATLTLSEDELALGNGLPSAYDGSPAVRGKFVAAGRVGRRFSKKRARTVDLIHQPPAKRHEAIRLYPIAARGRKRAAGADEGGVADCVQGSSRADSAGSQRVTRSKKDKTFPKSSGVQLGHDSLVQESEGPRSGKVPENPTASKPAPPM